MITRLNNGHMRGSLRHQIRAAAGQLAECRQAVRLRRTALGERLHASLTSPGMLLFAGSTGFFIAEFTGRAGRARDPKNPRKSKSSRRPMARAGTALRFALKMFMLAHAATTAMAGPGEVQNGT